MTVKAQIFTKQQILDFMQRVEPGSILAVLRESIEAAQSRFDFLNQGAGPGLLAALGCGQKPRAAPLPLTRSQPGGAGTARGPARSPGAAAAT